MRLTETVFSQSKSSIGALSIAKRYSKLETNILQHVFPIEHASPVQSRDHTRSWTSLDCLQIQLWTSLNTVRNILSVSTTSNDPLLILLGLENGREPRFALDVSSHNAQSLTEIASKDNNVEQSTTLFAVLRDEGGNLSSQDSGIMAQARSLMYWNTMQRFCGKCGAKTEVSHGGYQRDCTSCKVSHYPRTDPSVIMLVHNGEDKCILARATQWEKGRYSTLAGFMEPGETIEAAVKRETEEETGITVDNVTYFTSQPYPFPLSLMIGFYARAVNTDIVVNKELAHARWFSRDEVKAVLERKHPELRLAPKYTIANHLISNWVYNGIKQ